MGNRYRAVADHSLQLAVIGAPMIWIKRGTRLEIVRADERWDNHHADIIRFAHVEVSLRIMDGPSEGEDPPRHPARIGRRYGMEVIGPVPEGYM